MSGDSHTCIAREHLLGATIWAYAGGSATVKPWDQPSRIRTPRRLEDDEQ